MCSISTVHGSLFQHSIGLSLKDLLMFSKRRSFLSSRSSKFWLYSKPTDMRKNFNMLSGIVNNHMGKNLYSGDVFVLGKA